MADRSNQCSTASIRRTPPFLLPIQTAFLTATLLSTACGGANPTPSPSPTTPSPPVTGSTFYVFVNPTMLGVGETARASSGLRSPDTDATAQTSWKSLNPGIATISPTGIVMGISSGVALIQGQFNGTSATFPLEVISGADIVELMINKG